MTERELLDAVVEAARVLGWKVAHFRPAMTKHGWRTPVQGDGKGWPDLFLVHPLTGGLLVVELKAAKGRVTVEQEQWLEWLATAGLTVHVWAPDDWTSGRIEAALRSRNPKEATAA